jgi:uncharacterized protein YndB with AHSA1/START domain
MTVADDAADTVIVRRVLPVPREMVFDAWLDPVSLARFMRPGPMTGATAEVDARVGGTFRITMMRGPEADEHSGEYLAIEPPSRLSFTWISAGTDYTRSIVTIELHALDDSTELVLTHRRLPATKVDDHRQGWTDIVRMLDEMLAARR